MQALIHSHSFPHNSSHFPKQESLTCLIVLASDSVILYMSIRIWMRPYRCKFLFARRTGLLLLLQEKGIHSALHCEHRIGLQYVGLKAVVYWGFLKRLASYVQLLLWSSEAMEAWYILRDWWDKHCTVKFPPGEEGGDSGWCAGLQRGFLTLAQHAAVMERDFEDARLGQGPQCRSWRSCDFLIEELGISMET